jgi:hypothetical protein
MPQLTDLDNIAFITLTNNGYTEYTLNCLKSLDIINCKVPLIAYCIGNECFEKLSQSGYRCKLLNDNTNTNFQTFRTGNWSNITFKKFEIIYENLLNNNFICITDGDIVFENNNFYNYLLDNIGDNDIICQTDGNDIICSGFMFIKSNPNTLNLFNPDRMKDKSNQLGWDDQVYLNDIKHLLKYKLLPLNLFPNGDYYYKNYKTLTPYLIHFNWTLGHMKKQKMKEFNKWYLMNE